MKSRYTNTLMLLAAIAAFIPLLAVDWLLDTYVRTREQAALQRDAEALSGEIRATAGDTISSLRSLLAQNSSLCTPGFSAAIHDLMERSMTLRQVLVTNPDGVQYCDGLGRDLQAARLSDEMPLPGRSETMRLVQFEGMPVPALEIVSKYSDTRLVSAFAPIVSVDQARLVAGLHPGTRLDVVLADGNSIFSVGDLVGNADGVDSVMASALAGDMPIRVEVRVPFSAVRGDYADLDAILTVITSLMCGSLLLLALQLVRRSDLPSFELERAIAAGQIKPYYQPVINIRTGELAGCEVLARWEKPGGEVVTPGGFIEVAEATGLALPMTLSLMQQVRSDLGDLCRLAPELKVSINLFEGHFRNADIVEDVHALFEGSGIAFRQLVFEITERQPLTSKLHADSVMAGLHALGCRLAMDDVGTGHSNLSYLQTIGVDIIKIDRVFVNMVRAGVQQVPVLDGLITMARDLDTEIVAEGVETEEQAAYLRQRGVVMAQGYLFAPALRAAAFIHLATALRPGTVGADAILQADAEVPAESRSEPALDGSNDVGRGKDNASRAA